MEFVLSIVMNGSKSGFTLTNYLLTVR